MVTMGSCSDGLSTKVLPRGDGHGEHPQRNHGREVERRDASAHAQGLQQGVGVHAAGHVVGQLAQLQVADGAGVFHHFEAAEDVALGVGQGLALFGGQQRGQLGHVFADELLEFQEPYADRCVSPACECALG
jgi:hypothetical protein